MTTANNRKLNIVPDDYDDSVVEPTRAQMAIAAIEQSHREYRSSEKDVSNPQGWCPYTEPERRQRVIDVDDVVTRATKLVVVDSRVSLWRKVMRWLRK